MKGILEFKDELTINQISDGVHRLRNAIDKWDEVVIDFGDVKKIDLSAVQVIIAVQKECEKKGSRVIIKKSDAVVNLLSSSGIKL